MSHQAPHASPQDDKAAKGSLIKGPRLSQPGSPESHWFTRQLPIRRSPFEGGKLTAPSDQGLSGKSLPYLPGEIMTHTAGLVGGGQRATEGQEKRGRDKAEFQKENEKVKKK